MPETHTLDELVEELRHAKTRLEEAIRAEDRARSTTTSARNEVNALQKAIDAEIEKLHKELSVRESDWWNRAREFERKAVRERDNHVRHHD